MIAPSKINFNGEESPGTAEHKAFLTKGIRKDMESAAENKPPVKRQG